MCLLFLTDEPPTGDYFPEEVEAVPADHAVHRRRQPARRPRPLCVQMRGIPPPHRALRGLSLQLPLGARPALPAQDRRADLFPGRRLNSINAIFLSI